MSFLKLEEGEKRKREKKKELSAITTNIEVVLDIRMQD